MAVVMLVAAFAVFATPVALARFPAPGYKHSASRRCDLEPLLSFEIYAICGKPFPVKVSFECVAAKRVYIVYIAGFDEHSPNTFILFMKEFE